MFEKLGLTRMAQALAAHSGARVEVVARNIANADTPGFRAMDMPDFRTIYGDQVTFAPRRTRAAHLVNEESQWSQPVPSGTGMAPNGNDVSLDQQMMKAVAARQNHEMALAVYQNTSAILRTSLGRNT
ncbi:FlgB family protein [Pseudotabrizicola sediminis]|uniref:FlgB family protein n=1 Tax=Pseudotabrizicola sediminis TaxID=2486418 RepID=A0ABY2KI05_9RHOB|nr:FlgB family protein [Pseudotabrizicola sediminis]TGD41945.1 FlgB family protein [Pseudotabrizicola sediminis]TGD67381.1 FlgB family protein [Tabrizicola sp. WMC-M-20]